MQHKIFKLQKIVQRLY